jgi:hypothetical protein
MYHNPFAKGYVIEPSAFLDIAPRETQAKYLAAA